MNLDPLSDPIHRIIVPLLGMVLGAVVSRLIQVLVDRANPRYFIARKNATKLMLDDMRSSAHLVFIGIKHDRLTSYFKTVEQSAGDNEDLPWQEIDIYFADQQLGELWAGEEFNKKVPETIWSIIKYFHETRKRYPKLQAVRFYENRVFTTFSGSLFKYSEESKTVPFTVIYSVIGIKSSVNSDTEYAHTSRLQARKHKHKPEFNVSHDMYLAIKERAQQLFTFNLKEWNEWDRSVDTWSTFIGSYPVYRKCMDDMLSFAEIKLSDKVLELGCGTGQLSFQIATKLGEHGSLVLLDSSVQMLEKARSNVGVGKPAIYLLSDARSVEPLYGVARKIPFNKIICHFSFHHFVDGREETAYGFAEKWKQHLSKGGEVIFSIHNTHLRDLQEDYPDKLRDAFMQAGFHFLPTQPTLCKEMLIADFDSAGYSLKGHEKMRYERTYADRIAMWRSPAILKGALKDFDDRDYDKARRILDELQRSCGAERSEKTTLYLFRFQLEDRQPRKIVTVNALIQDKTGRFLAARKGKHYLLPGGRRLPHEAELDTLKREVLEETGLRITEWQKVGTYSFEKAFIENNPLEMNVYHVVAEEISPGPRSEITELRWVSADDLGLLDTAEFPVRWWRPIVEEAQNKGILPKR